MIEIGIEELISKKEEGLSDKKIAEYFTAKGKKISSTTVNIRLNEYYASTEKNKPKAKIKKDKKIKITDQELVDLKEKGYSERKIAEHFTSRGIQIGATTVHTRLKEYYATIGKNKPKTKIKRKKKLKITDQELIDLKEEGLSDERIAEHLTAKGKKISETTVNKRLNEYYATIEKNKPKTKIKREKKIKVTDQELVDLKEKGYSERRIVEHFTSKGIQIGKTTVNRRLKEYYASTGKSRPKTKIERPKKIVTITDKELADLKAEGLSYKAIAEHLTQEGKKISETTVYKRLKEYYDKENKEVPRTNPKPKTGITEKELVNLKEDGFKDEEISRYFTSKGRKITQSSVSRRLTRYYENKGKVRPGVKVDIQDEELANLKEKGFTDKEISDKVSDIDKKLTPEAISVRLRKYYSEIKKSKPEALIGSKKRITDKELLDLRKTGLSHKKIAEHLTMQGKSISEATVWSRLNKIKDKEYIDESIRYALLNGYSIIEYKKIKDEEFIKQLKERLKRLKIIAEHREKNEDKWIKDGDILLVIKLIKSSQIELIDTKFGKEIDKYLEDGICKRSNINLLIQDLFKGNKDLMLYVTNRLQIMFSEDADVVLDNYKREYKQKIDKYFERLYRIEEKRDKEKVSSVTEYLDASEEDVDIG